MSKRFYEIELYPKNNECPNGENDCNGCEFCKHIGTFWGDFMLIVNIMIINNCVYTYDLETDKDSLKNTTYI